MIKNFKDFLNESYGESYGESPSFPEWFSEVFEDIILQYEQRLKREGVLKNDSLWDNLGELDKQHEFDMDMEAFYVNRQHIYFGYDKETGDYVNTPEYDRIVSKIKLTDYKMRNTAINKALVSNVIEKNWEDWKKLYQKWIKYVEDRRGTILGRKFGI